jgi:predicted GTPase
VAASKAQLYASTASASPISDSQYSSSFYVQKLPSLDTTTDDRHALAMKIPSTLYHGGIPQANPVYKVAFLGFEGCGKSALVCRYVFGSYRVDHMPTVEDIYTKEVLVDGGSCDLEILDTPGNEEMFYKVLIQE